MTGLWLGIALAAATVVMAMILPQQAAAQSVDDQRREVQRIVDELERLHERADILAEDYAVAVDDQRMLSGEIAVGHSYVRGGDYPELTNPRTGLLGADVSTVDGAYRIERIYSGEL